MSKTSKQSSLPALRDSRLRMRIAVCFSFNVIGRLADAFGFVVPGPEALEAARIPPRARLPLSAHGKLAGGALRLIDSF